MYRDTEIATQAAAHLAGVVTTERSPVVRLVSVLVALVGLKKAYSGRIFGCLFVWVCQSEFT